MGDGQAQIQHRRKDESKLARFKAWSDSTRQRLQTRYRTFNKRLSTFEVSSVTAFLASLSCAVLLWTVWSIWGARFVQALILFGNGEEPQNLQQPATKTAPTSERFTVVVPEMDRAASAAGRVEVQVNVHESQTKEEESRLAKMGQAGDSYGGANALFAAIAGGLVLWAGLLQRRALIEARSTNNQQRFDSVFFELLGLVRNLEERLKRSRPAGGASHVPVRRLNRHSQRSPRFRAEDAPRDSEGVEHHGAYAIAAWAKALSDRVYQETGGFKLPDSSSFLASYFHHNIYEPNASSLGPYFRVLFRVFWHIDHADLPIGEKKQYLALTRGALSEDSIFLAVAYALGPYGAPFRGHILKFDLLEQVGARHKEFLCRALYPIRDIGDSSPPDPLPTSAGQKLKLSVLSAMHEIEMQHVPRIDKSLLY